RRSPDASPPHGGNRRGWGGAGRSSSNLSCETSYASVPGAARRRGAPLRGSPSALADDRDGPGGHGVGAVRIGAAHQGEPADLHHLVERGLLEHTEVEQAVLGQAANT